MLTDNENLIQLIKQLEQLDHVIQVRFHKVLKQKFVDQVGQDGINILCIVPSTMAEDVFVRFTTLLPNEVYNNINMHPSVINSIKTRIDDYILNNTPPVKY
mgnify:FL=1|jgi:hypothetical protein